MTSAKNIQFQKAKVLRAHKNHACSRFQEKRARNDGVKDACFAERQRNWALQLEPNRPMGKTKKILFKEEFLPYSSEKGLSRIFYQQNELPRSKLRGIKNSEARIQEPE